MKRGITWLQLMIAAVVTVLGLVLAMRTQGLSRPHQQVALLGGFLMIVIATAGFELYARRFLHRESRLLEPVGRAVARAILNTVSLAWLLAAGFLLYVVASGRSSTVFQASIAVLFAAALVAGWWLKRYLRMDSLLPYAITTIAAMLSLTLYAAPALAQVATLDDDERAVLAAAIEQTRLQGNEKWVMVDNDVATFQCGGGTTITVGGCGGMRRKTQSVEEVMAWLQNQLPDAGAAALANFRTRAEFPTTVGKPLPLRAPQVLWGRLADGKKGVVAGGPAPRGNPDYLFNVSRVGFDPAHHDAVAYVAGVSWADASRQYAEYLHLRNLDGKWTVHARVRVWHLGPGSPDAKKPDQPGKR